MALLSLLHLVLLLFTWSSKTESRCPTLVKPGCDEWCGLEIPIPYPFGIGESCYMNPNFAVTCENSPDGSKPFLKSIGMELLGVSLQGFVWVNNTVISSNCSNRVDTNTAVDISNSSFTYSSSRNKFTAMGCDNFAMLLQDGQTIGGCLSICGNSMNSTTNGCYGIDCCQTTIPSSINSFEANMSYVMTDGQFGDCRTAFMVDQEWFDTEVSVNYTPSVEAVKQRESVPAVLEWGYVQGSCDINTVSFCSSNGYCWEEVDQSHLCVCSANDFSADTAQHILRSCYASDLEKCLPSDDLRYCRLYCVNSQGNNNCSCPTGYSSYNNGRCYQPYRSETRSRVKAILVGCGSAIGLLLLLIGAWLSYKVIKRRQKKKLKQKFFKRNGGLLLEQQLSSSQTTIEQTKVFSLTELEKATDNFHEDRILGRGGQGTVYKGMLTDGRIVAIKKSKVIDENQLDQFINEVVILSQINHRNVVKLLGCCLEAEVPLLVYEFISNGTLFQHIHDPSEEFPFTWEIRLRIAIEVSSALSYMHSAASMPIYHRDIKSSNILLDDKYRAKVADFGTSKTISIDQTHVTTRVQGTFGYLDPEYFQSSQFTEKSDVYSFGVVLIELLTGLKPIFKTQSAEDRNLSYYFLELMEEDRVMEILDPRVAKEATKEEVMAVANIAKRCLNMKGKKRPTMKTITIELEEIKASKGGTCIAKYDYEEVDYSASEMGAGPWDATSSSTESRFTNNSLGIFIDV